MIEKAKYPDIVAEFRSVGELSPEQMVCLADTIAQVSEEIFEHYKALCDLLKGQLQRVRRICREEGCKKAFPQEADRQLLARALERDRKSTRLNSSHITLSRMPSSA